MFDRMIGSNLRSWVFAVVLLCGIILTVIQLNRNSSFKPYKPNPAKNQNGMKEHTKLQTENLKDKQQRLPNALIIGRAKSGTMALRQWLSKHPDIVLITRDPPFFATEPYSANLESYRRSMPYSTRGQITIDAFPNYFTMENVSERIYEFNPTIPLILIIRDPITRFVSAYAHEYAKPGSKMRKISIDDFVQQKTHEKQSQIMVNGGSYQRHFNRWLQYFPRHQIHVVDGDKLASENPAKELRKVESFLKLRHFLTESHFIFSKRKGFYCYHWKRTQQCLSSRKGRPHPPLSSKSLAILKKYFEQDLISVRDLIATNVNNDTKK